MAVHSNLFGGTCVTDIILVVMSRWDSIPNVNRNCKSPDGLAHEWHFGPDLGTILQYLRGKYPDAWTCSSDNWDTYAGENVVIFYFSDELEKSRFIQEQIRAGGDGSPFCAKVTDAPQYDNEIHVRPRICIVVSRFSYYDSRWFWTDVDSHVRLIGMHNRYCNTYDWHQAKPEFCNEYIW